MRIAVENPMTLDSATEKGALEHPLIFRRGHEISGRETRSVRGVYAQSIERRRLLHSECAPELVCHLQFNHGNSAAIFVWSPSVAPRMREPSMHCWFTVSSSSRGVSPSHQFPPLHGDRSPRASVGAQAVTDRAGRGDFELPSDVAGISGPCAVIGITFLFCGSKPVQVGGIRSDG